MIREKSTVEQKRRCFRPRARRFSLAHLPLRPRAVSIYFGVETPPAIHFPIFDSSPARRGRVALARAFDSPRPINRRRRRRRRRSVCRDNSRHYLLVSLYYCAPDFSHTVRGDDIIL